MVHNGKAIREFQQDTAIGIWPTAARIMFGTWLLAFTVFLLPIRFGYSQSPKVPAAQAVGSFQGAAITMADLNKAAAIDLERAEIQHLQNEAAHLRAKHLSLEKALARIIEDKSLTVEAASRGLTRQALLDKELAGKVKILGNARLVVSNGSARDRVSEFACRAAPS